jgi:DNA modification methylase
MANAMTRHTNFLLSTIAALPHSSGGTDWRVVRGDCLATLPLLPKKSVDLIFADPPYNLQLKGELYRPNMTRVNGVDDDWDKFESFEAYDKFCLQWLTECRRILKDSGTMWVIGTYHNIGRLGRLMQDAGYWLLNDVIWHKSNPMPNFRGVRFTNATETLIWAKKSEKSKYTFNHHCMKTENGGKQMTNVWSFSLCGGKERLRDVEGNKLHSTQKPEALLRRVILSSSKVGDVVLDPFLGSGTTLAVARQLGRLGVGIENNKCYLGAAIKRIKSVKINLVNNEIGHKKILRVAFKKLIEKGYIKKGRKVYCKKEKTTATVLQSGKLKLNGIHNISGSIHQMGAKAANSEGCNGWNYWYLREEKKLVSINEIREKYRNAFPEEVSDGR